MTVITHCTRIAISSALLMLSLGESHGRQLQNFGGVASAASGVDITDRMSEMEQELSRVCTDDPSLDYLHYDANLGSTSLKDCSWVGQSPDDRCELYASSSGRSATGATTPDLLRNICPLSCGLCPTDLVDPERDIDRQGNVSTDDFTLEQIKELEIRLRRQKQNYKKKRKGRKPCPCPDGQDHSVGVGGDSGGGNNNSGGDSGGDSDGIRVTEVPVPSPVEIPVPDEVPAPGPAPGPDQGSDQDFDEPTFWPTSYVSTLGPTSASSFRQSIEGSATASWSSSSSTSWSSSSTTSSSGEDEGAVIGAFISGQQSSLNQRRSNRRVLAVTLTVIPFVLLLLVICCLLRWKRRREGMKEDSGTDESDTEYPIHKTKSADSEESRFKKVLGYFNGRQEDERTNVHRCTSATCEVCDPSVPRRVMSVDSYTDELANPTMVANPTTLEEGERYRGVMDRVREMEC